MRVWSTCLFTISCIANGRGNKWGRVLVFASAAQASPDEINLWSTLCLFTHRLSRYTCVDLIERDGQSVESLTGPQFPQSRTAIFVQAALSVAQSSTRSSLNPGIRFGLGFQLISKGNEMKLINMLANSMVAVSLMAAPAAFAEDHPGKMKMDKMNMDEFMKSCDMDKDGMMSKAEMLAHMEKMFDKMDTKKTGKLDKKQSELFLKQFNTISGG